LYSTFLGICAFFCTDGGKVKKPFSRRQKQRARKRAKKLEDLTEKTKFSRRSGKQLLKEAGMECFYNMYLLC
jgi:hypothetical protein